MRIALVVTELETGGAENCVTELAIFLASRGHEVRLLSLGPEPQPPRNDLVERLRAARLDIRFGDAHRLSHILRVQRWLSKELHQFDPDIVQTMLWHANVLGALALRGHRAQLVGGMRVSEPRRWRWPLERISARRMSAMVCVSEQVRQHALLCEQLPARKLVCIPNGIADRAAIPPLPACWSELGLPTLEHVMLFVGRLEKQKGILQLAQKHLSAILSELPAWHLVVVGQGSLQHSIEQHVRRQGLSDRVHCVGWQPQPMRWMTASDLLILPALYEGMPNVLLEAMAVGRPFVSFAVDGVPQLLGEGFSRELADAQIVPPGNWSEFVARVRRLANDSALRAACGEANRLQVEKNFRLEAQLAKYEALYKSLVAEASSL